MTRFFLLFCLLALAGPGTLLAGPMGFKDSWMAMGEFGRHWRESWANYALTPRDALGAGYVWMEADGGGQRRELSELTYTRLLARWNLPHAQANVWLLGGLGRVKGSDFGGSRTMAAPGLQLDYETTRVYVAASARLYRARGLNHDYGALRAGFSFYETGYDETQPWLILEARRMRGLSEETEITPMLRLINKRYFVEFGVNQAREPRANFMYIF